MRRGREQLKNRYGAENQTRFAFHHAYFLSTERLFTALPYMHGLAAKPVILLQLICGPPAQTHIHRWVGVESPNTGGFMPERASGEATRLQNRNTGEEGAQTEITPVLYRELRRVASSYLRRERPDHTLEPTALVHEAYLRLIAQTGVESRTRSQFLAIAANLMRQILVNHARDRRAAKRGGGLTVALEDDACEVQPRGVDLISLDEALETLARVDPRAGRIVELRFFGGFTEQEIADVLGVSIVTVQRDWRLARAMLRSLLRKDGSTCERQP